MNENLDVIQIYNNTKTHASGKEQYKCTKSAETQGTVAGPNCKTFHWIVTFCQTKQKTNMTLNNGTV